MKKTLKFANFVVNKKEFHASKKFKAIVLNFVNTDNNLNLMRNLQNVLLAILMIILLWYYYDIGKNISFQIEDDNIFSNKLKFETKLKRN